MPTSQHINDNYYKNNVLNSKYTGREIKKLIEEDYYFHKDCFNKRLVIRILTIKKALTKLQIIIAQKIDVTDEYE